MNVEIALRRAALANTFADIDAQIAALDPKAAAPIARHPSPMLARFFGLAVRLPLATDLDFPGQVFDADGARVLVIDPGHYPRDSTAVAIAALVVQSVNRQAGLL